MEDFRRRGRRRSRWRRRRRRNRRRRRGKAKRTRTRRGRTRVGLDPGDEKKDNDEATDERRRGRACVNGMAHALAIKNGFDEMMMKMIGVCFDCHLARRSGVAPLAARTAPKH